MQDKAAIRRPLLRGELRLDIRQTRARPSMATVGMLLGTSAEGNGSIERLASGHRHLGYEHAVHSKSSGRPSQGIDRKLH